MTGGADDGGVGSRRRRRRRHLYLFPRAFLGDGFGSGMHAFHQRNHDPRLSHLRRRHRGLALRKGSSDGIVCSMNSVLLIS